MKHLGNKETRELNSQIEKLYHLPNLIDKKNKVIIDNNILDIDNEKAFFFVDNLPIPTLKKILNDNTIYNRMKKVTVDMGAIKFVTSGADIMRPGIIEFDEDINKEDIVLIIDQSHKKPLAIGKMIFSGEESKQMKTGKVVKNLHYVSDEIWNA
jgi:PUA-domain protein